MCRPGQPGRPPVLGISSDPVPVEFLSLFYIRKKGVHVQGVQSQEVSTACAQITVVKRRPPRSRPGPD